ncbi:M23 family metallopeptidase [Evansella sp. AB-P1]|uniref:M23 family metallopeptidase n=1 Tax=Evansella sp. AB-P1 TaxID=3037653 RepID=UPI00241C5065|nr:M23 family metallopeptidase [Evansella sp. AB-P1]MDG5786845.1 M23 family metallopeptidase [Evansella sp. AB-P1]
MKNRVNKLKRKIDAKRKRRKHSPHYQVLRERDRRGEMIPFSVKHDEEREDTLYSYDNRNAYSSTKGESFFRKDRFMMQVLASVCLFFIIGIIVQSQTPVLEGARGYVEKSFQEEFQFSTVANWYENAFGHPLALVPPNLDTVAPGDIENDINENNYALPATGTVRESFQQNGRGIYVETVSNERVEAVRSGVVRYVGEDEANEWGKVIIVRHYDDTEAWYGMLDDISVKVHDHVDSGDLLGRVTSHEENEEVGIYYFALREGNRFVDPSEVISFD